MQRVSLAILYGLDTVNPYNAKVKMAPETCQRGRKHYDKSNVIFGIYMDT